MSITYLFAIIYNNYAKPCTPWDIKSASVLALAASLGVPWVGAGPDATRCVADERRHVNTVPRPGRGGTPSVYRLDDCRPWEPPAQSTRTPSRPPSKSKLDGSG